LDAILHLPTTITFFCRLFLVFFYYPPFLVLPPPRSLVRSGFPTIPLTPTVLFLFSCHSFDRDPQLLLLSTISRAIVGARPEVPFPDTDSEPAVTQWDPLVFGVWADVRFLRGTAFLMF